MVEMSGPKRKTGINILGDIPWGTHFCQFYQTKQDLIDILVPYFKAGLENNEFCMWVTSKPLNAKEAEAALQKAVSDLDQYIKKGQIEILDFSQWYTMTGKFEADKVLQGWVDKEQQALKNGFAGLRLTGNTFWIEKKDWQSFSDYEAVINKVIHNYKMLAICTYSLDKCDTNEVLDVFSTHQFAIIKRNNKWITIESSECKRVDEKLRESEEKYKAIFENSNDVISCVDKLGKFLDINQRVEDVLGYKREEIIGKNFATLGVLSFKDLPQIVKLFTDTIREGKAKEFVELELKHKKGHKVSMEVSTRFVKRNGKIEGLVNIFRDITERKRAEEVLRESERRLQEAQELGQIGNWEYDLASQKIVWSDQAFRLYERDPSLGPPTADEEAGYYSPEQAKILREFAAKAIETGEEFIYDLQANLPSGKTAYFYSTMRPVKDEKGRVIKLFGTVQNITERKQAEEELRKAKEYTENIISDMIDSLIVVDSQAKILTINEATEKLLGYTREELIGQPVGMIFEEEEEEEEEFKGIGLRGLIKKGFIKSQEKIYKIKKGASIPVLFSGSVMRDENGKIQGIVCVARDISKLKELQEELLKAGKMTVVGELGAGVAHQLNNPLGAIIGFAQLLLKDVSSRDSKYDDLKKIEQAGLRCKRIIESLLRFSRPGEAMVKRVSINKLIKETVFLFEQQSKAWTNIKISTDLQRFMPRICGNPNQLEQVFLNMLTNAQNALPVGGKIRVSTKMDKEKGSILIIFEDNGTGIAERDLYNIFKPFYTLKKNPESLGLGLTLSVRIVESHKGSIDVESVLGKGTRFTVNLPI